MAWRPDLNRFFAFRRDGAARAATQAAGAGPPPIDQMAVAFARLTQAHRQELAEARALLVRYRYFIEEHGLEPPDDSGAEALRRFRHAFHMAGASDSMQHSELLDDWSTVFRQMKAVAA